MHYRFLGIELRKLLTMAIASNIISIMSLSMAFSFLYIFKEILDKESMIKKHPWLAKKKFRVVSAFSLCSLFLIAFQPYQALFPFLLFIFSSSLALGYILFSLRKQGKLKNYQTINNMKKILKNWRIIVASLISIAILGGGIWYYTNTTKQESTPLQMAFESSPDFTIIPTAMDSLNPEAPLKVYRVHYLTYRDFEVSGQGLPTYQAKDYYTDVRLFAARGRLNWNNLNGFDSTVLKVFQPVVFLGKQ